MNDWSGEERRSEDRASRRAGDVCPMKRECPVILTRLRDDMDSIKGKVGEINGHVRVLDTDVAPIRSVVTRRIGAVLGAALCFAGGVIWTQQGALSRVVARQEGVLARLDGHDAKLDTNDKNTEAWRTAISQKLDRLLERSHAHDERGRVLTGAAR